MSRRSSRAKADVEEKLPATTPRARPAATKTPRLPRPSSLVPGATVIDSKTTMLQASPTMVDEVVEQDLVFPLMDHDLRDRLVPGGSVTKHIRMVIHHETGELVPVEVESSPTATSAVRTALASKAFSSSSSSSSSSTTNARGRRSTRAAPAANAPAPSDDFDFDVPELAPPPFAAAKNAAKPRIVSTVAAPMTPRAGSSSSSSAPARASLDLVQSATAAVKSASAAVARVVSPLHQLVSRQQPPGAHAAAVHQNDGERRVTMGALLVLLLALLWWLFLAGSGGDAVVAPAAPPTTFASVTAALAAIQSTLAAAAIDPYTATTGNANVASDELHTALHALEAALQRLNAIASSSSSSSSVAADAPLSVSSVSALLALLDAQHRRVLVALAHRSHAAARAAHTQASDTAAAALQAASSAAADNANTGAANGNVADRNAADTVGAHVTRILAALERSSAQRAAVDAAGANVLAAAQGDAREAERALLHALAEASAHAAYTATNASHAAAGVVGVAAEWRALLASVRTEVGVALERVRAFENANAAALSAQTQAHEKQRAEQVEQQRAALDATSNSLAHLGKRIDALSAVVDVLHAQPAALSSSSIEAGCTAAACAATGAAAAATQTALTAAQDTWASEVASLRALVTGVQASLAEAVEAAQTSGA